MLFCGAPRLEFALHFPGRFECYGPDLRHWRAGIELLDCVGCGPYRLNVPLARPAAWSPAEKRQLIGGFCNRLLDFLAAPPRRESLFHRGQHKAINNVVGMAWAKVGKGLFDGLVYIELGFPWHVLGQAFQPVGHPLRQPFPANSPGLGFKGRSSACRVRCLLPAPAVAEPIEAFFLGPLQVYGVHLVFEAHNIIGRGNRFLGWSREKRGMRTPSFPRRCLALRFRAFEHGRREFGQPVFAESLNLAIRDSPISAGGRPRCN